MVRTPHSTASQTAIIVLLEELANPNTVLDTNDVLKIVYQEDPSLTVITTLLKEQETPSISSNALIRFLTLALEQSKHDEHHFSIEYFTNIDTILTHLKAREDFDDSVLDNEALNRSTNQVIEDLILNTPQPKHTQAMMPCLIEILSRQTNSDKSYEKIVANLIETIQNWNPQEDLFDYSKRFINQVSLLTILIQSKVKYSLDIQTRMLECICNASLTIEVLETYDMGPEWIKPDHQRSIEELAWDLTKRFIQLYRKEIKTEQMKPNSINEELYQKEANACFKELVRTSIISIAALKRTMQEKMTASIADAMHRGDYRI